MNKLLRAYGFQSDMQYFEMICESFVNGQRSQAKEQFTAMPRKNRIAFLHSATVGGWDSGLSNQNLSLLFEITL